MVSKPSIRAPCSVWSLHPVWLTRLLVRVRAAHGCQHTTCWQGGQATKPGEAAWGLEGLHGSEQMTGAAVIDPEVTL